MHYISRKINPTSNLLARLGTEHNLSCHILRNTRRYFNLNSINADLQLSIDRERSPGQRDKNKPIHEKLQ